MQTSEMDSVMFDPNASCIDEFLADSTSDTRMKPTQKQTTGRGARKAMPCYLCFFAEEQVCVQYSKYIINESQRCCKKQIARQIADDIETREARDGTTSEGASASDIEKHISEHMLHPNVKVPEIIRELDGIRRLLRSSITTTDPDTGDRVIDTGNVTLYLKVIRELNQVYKMGDTAKLTLGSGGGTSLISALNTDL
jgi:hypothetical protein